MRITIRALAACTLGLISSLATSPSIFAQVREPQEQPGGRFVEDLYYPGPDAVPVRLLLDRLAYVAVQGEGLPDTLAIDHPAAPGQTIEIRLDRMIAAGIGVYQIGPRLSRTQLAKVVNQDDRNSLFLIAMRADTETPILFHRQLIVHFRKTLTDEEKEDFARRLGIELTQKVPGEPGISILWLAPDSTDDALALANTLTDRSGVDYALPNYLLIFRLHAIPESPTDPLYGNQWNLERSQVPEAWTYMRDHMRPEDWSDWTSASQDPAGDSDLAPNDVLISVLDSAIQVAAAASVGDDLDHPDLHDSLFKNVLLLGGTETTVPSTDADGNGYCNDVQGWDFYATTDSSCGRGDPIPRPVPPSGAASGSWTEEHGTWVAGAALARGDNEEGIVGSCPFCFLRPLRALDVVEETGMNFETDFTNAINYSWCHKFEAGACTVRAGDIANISFSVHEGQGSLEIYDSMHAAALNSLLVVAMENEDLDICGQGPSDDAPVDLSGLSEEERLARRRDWWPLEFSTNELLLVGGSTTDDRKSPDSAWASCRPFVVAPESAAGGPPHVWSTDRTGRADDTSSQGINLNGDRTAGGEECSSDGTLNPAYTSCEDGNSIAAPLVSGIGGLILTMDPSLSPRAVKRLILDTADKIDPMYDRPSNTSSYDSPSVRPDSSTPENLATHRGFDAASKGFGRVNALEAVRVAEKGVDLFVRDNPVDWGNTGQTLSDPGACGGAPRCPAQPSSRTREMPPQNIPFFVSPDIRLDSVEGGLSSPTTAWEFLQADKGQRLRSGESGRVHVRVRNRGTRPADNVKVKLLVANYSMGFPSFAPHESCIYEDFSGTDCLAGTGSGWDQIGVQTIAEVPYSGAAVASLVHGHPVGDPAKVVSFSFTAPEVTSPAENHYCFYVIVVEDRDGDGLADSDPDPVEFKVASPNRATKWNNNVTHLNSRIIPAAEDTDAAARRSTTTVVGMHNPFSTPITTMMTAWMPTEFDLEVVNGPALGEWIEMDPGESREVSVFISSRQTRHDVRVGLSQELRTGQAQTEVLGGVTFVFEGTEEPIDRDALEECWREGRDECVEYVQVPGNGLSRLLKDLAGKSSVWVVVTVLLVSIILVQSVRLASRKRRS